MNLDNTKVLECRQIVSEWISANENEFVDIISSGGERPKFVTKMERRIRRKNEKVTFRQKMTARRIISAGQTYVPYWRHQ